MEEYIYLLRTYLPVEFEDLETNEFIEYLVAAYLENLAKEKFQFSFAAFHMLYMSFVFKVNWFLKQQGSEVIIESLKAQAQQNKFVFNTLFDLSQINEKTTLEKLMLGLSFHANEIGICKSFVDVRNNCLHASGKVYYKRSDQVGHYIDQALANVIAIQKKVIPELKKLLEKFIEETYEKKWIEMEIRRWILDNHLSEKDISEILVFKPLFLSKKSDNYEVILKKLLYCGLISGLVKYIDNKENYFIGSLKSLMHGLPSQINISKDKADYKKTKNSRELIEEKIVPILANLSNKETMEAEKVLNLHRFK